MKDQQNNISPGELDLQIEEVTGLHKAYNDLSGRVCALEDALGSDRDFVERLASKLEQLEHKLEAPRSETTPDFMQPTSKACERLEEITTTLADSGLPEGAEIVRRFDSYDVKTLQERIEELRKHRRDRRQAALETVESVRRTLSIAMAGQTLVVDSGFFPGAGDMYRLRMAVGDRSEYRTWAEKKEPGSVFDAVEIIGSGGGGWTVSLGEIVWSPTGTWFYRAPQVQVFGSLDALLDFMAERAVRRELRKEDEKIGMH